MGILKDSKITMQNPTPIFRIFDEEKAKDFYITYLGFSLDWEHRFENDLPLYMQISFENCRIHLSEHHGDCSPGAAIRIEVENLTLFHSNLLLRNYKYSRPGIETTPWDSEEVCVIDPFGNRIIFFQNVER